MKKITLSFLLLVSISVFAQNAAFKMPAEIKFTKNVVQKITGEKSNATITYYFTSTSDYMAMKPEAKEGTLIIYTKEGNMLVVNDKEKSILVMNLGKFITDAARRSKEMGKSKNGKDSIDVKSSCRKTGNSKTISGYTADEYEVKRDNDLMNLWYIKADFDANLLGYLGMGKMGNMPSGKSASVPSEFANIPAIGRNSFLAEMEKNGKKIVETVSIADSDYSFSSGGYTVRDMSGLMKGNYNQ